MIVGTAGHIDHGKTSLVYALTGKNTDRLPEEKRRGISIALGYAYRDVQGQPGLLGFVDVPGHEKFVHTMVAGASGIDHALLVIACDDGPMPQTREHLDILRLLGIGHGTVVLTKRDRVPDARMPGLSAEVAALVAGSPAADWPVFEVASVTGMGIASLEQRLADLALQMGQRPVAGLFRLAIDRSFAVAGHGTVVTGTAWSGSVQTGDEIWVSCLRQSVRVRGLHAQDHDADQGFAGQRLALNLAGVSHTQIRHGDWVCGTEPRMSYTFDALLQVSAFQPTPIRGGLEVHLHHAGLDSLARLHPLGASALEPGQDGLVAIQTREPLHLCSTDRFIIRNSQARTTLAGGRVLDPAPPRRGRRLAARLSLLKELSEIARPAEAVAIHVRHAPVLRTDLRACWNLTEAELDSALEGQAVVQASGQLFYRPHWEQRMSLVETAVDDTHRLEPEMPGIELQRLRRRTVASLSKEAFADLIDAMVAQGRIVRRGAFVARASHRAELSAADKALWQSVEPLLRAQPYNPPRVRDIARELNIPEKEVRQLLQRVARTGEVCLVAVDHFFLTASVGNMAELVRSLGQSAIEVRAADFRDLIGTGRKVAIQILEFFDRVGYTRRIRDNHLIRGQNPWR